MNCINQKKKKSVIFRRGTVHYTGFGLTSPHQRSDEYPKHNRTIQASFGVWFNPDIPVRTVALPSFLHPLWKPHLHKNPYVQKSRACCLPFIQIKNWCYYLAGVTLLIWKNASSYSKKTVWEACVPLVLSLAFIGSIVFPQSSLTRAVSSLPTSARIAASLDAPLLLKFFDFGLFRIPHIPYFYHNS